MEQAARQVAVAVDNALNYEAARPTKRNWRTSATAYARCSKSTTRWSAAWPAQFFQRHCGVAAPHLSAWIIPACWSTTPKSSALRLQMLDFPGGTGAIREDAVVPLETLWPATSFAPARAVSSAWRRPAPSPPPPPKCWPARAWSRSAACRWSRAARRWGR